MPTTLITSTPPKRIRLDKLAPGAVVELNFRPNTEGESWEEAIFLGMIGEGDDRNARFMQLVNAGVNLAQPLIWEAYRYNGHWAFGSSAERMRVESITWSMPVGA